MLVVFSSGIQADLTYNPMFVFILKLESDTWTIICPLIQS